jgi:hypothetical protein
MHQTVQLFNVNFDSPCGRHENVCGYVSMCVSRSVCIVPLEKALGLPSPGGRNRKVSEVNSQKTHIHQTQQHKTRHTHTHIHTHIGVRERETERERQRASERAREQLVTSVQGGALSEPLNRNKSSILRPTLELFLLVEAKLCTTLPVAQGFKNQELKAAYTSSFMPHACAKAGESAKKSGISSCRATHP